MSTAGPAQSTGPLGQGLEVSMITPKPLSAAYFTSIGPIFCRMRCAISFCWFWASSRASCTWRSSDFCFCSICFTSVPRLSSFSLSPWVLSCFFRALDFVVLAS